MTMGDDRAEGGRMRVPHRVVEDCWYSCPKSGECCNDAAGDECNCGADTYNEYIETLESWRDRRAEEISLDLAAYVERVRMLTKAIDQALHELRVPNDGYPAPVVNAVRILDDTRKNPSG